jgi:dTDP-4-amino-4,6-dideoxygalactose transaminase
MGERFSVPFGTMSVTERGVDLVNQALQSGRISSGLRVREFEQRFAHLVGAREAVAVSTGTDADTIALAVLHDFGADRGDEVIVPALSFVATGNAVVHAGFRPVFVDVDRQTLNIDPGQIESAITEKTRAIMPVHLMGKPAEMDSITELARRHDLPVIEDAAEAHGALYRGKPVGSMGDMGAFSLYIAHIITTGEGGIVTTGNSDFAEVLRSLRSHGRACTCRECSINTGSRRCTKRFTGEKGEDIRFSFERIGYSCKMNEIEAAIGLGNLDIYQEILDKRRQNLLHFLERFDRFHPYLSTITEGPGERIGPHAIPIVIQEEASFSRVDLTSYLESHGIETRTLFAAMPTQCAGFAFLGHRLGQFPNAEYLGENGIHVGVHQDLGIEDMDYVLEILESFLDSRQN